MDLSYSGFIDLLVVFTLKSFGAFWDVLNLGVKGCHLGNWVILSVHRKDEPLLLSGVAFEVLGALSQIKVIPLGIEITWQAGIFDSDDVSLDARVAGISA